MTTEITEHVLTQDEITERDAKLKEELNKVVKQLNEKRKKEDDERKSLPKEYFNETVLITLDDEMYILPSRYALLKGAKIKQSIINDLNCLETDELNGFIEKVPELKQYFK